MTSPAAPTDAPASRCPVCEKPVVWVGNPARPFCSVTCKLIDLGGWLDQRYRVAGEPLSPKPGPATDARRPDE